MRHVVCGRLLPAVVAIACALSACQTMVAVKPLPENEIAKIGIGKVSVAYNPTDSSMQSDMSAEFKQNLEAKIEQATRHCGAGDITRDVSVSILYYRRANPALTVLLGDSNQLHGTVNFLDPATNVTAGEYKLVVAEGGGGLLGVAIMANGDDWMSREFATRICKQILKREAPAKFAPVTAAPAPAAAPAAPAPVATPAASAPAATQNAAP